MDHYNGTGVPVSYERAAELLTRAAEMGHAGAQHNLGSMYSEGRGVPQSDGEAVEWYRRAADQGHADA